MTQPDYVPLIDVDEVRPTDRLRTPRPWTPSRPGDVGATGPRPGRRLGTPGPDQGFALGLARRFESRLALAEGEEVADAVQGCLGVALRRAALFGRAPVVHDCEHAFRLFGFLGSAPDDLVRFRRPLFQAASHHYWDQRRIADLVSEETLRLTPAEVAAKLADWQSLLDL
jgi:hypothetical protein